MISTLLAISIQCYFFSDPLQKEDSDSLSPDVILGIEEWGDTSSDLNENSDFCQYCYISKHLEFQDAENKQLPSYGDCFVGSVREVVHPLQPSNKQFYNNSYGCHLPPKTELTPCDDPKSNICCQVCGQKFAKLKYLKNHIKRFSTTDENRPFKCLFCSHSFMHEKNRKFHERVHNNKLIPCCHCPQTFVDLTTARMHINEAHQNKVHVCNDCGMNYSSSSHLQRHRRDVRKDFPHECFVCGHKYMTVVALNRHKFQHVRVKPFKCKICLKTFTSKTQLTKHLKHQNKGKRYECPNCEVKFAAQKSLRKHERLFNGDRPFKCTVCGHGYNSNTRLTMHMTVHGKVRRSMGKKPIYM